MPLTIIQHNVLHLKNRLGPLLTTYQEYNPDIILLNSTSIKTEEPLYIPGYNTVKKNISNEASDGTSISIKKGIVFKEINMDSRVQAIEITYHHIKLTIATTYLPPRFDHVPEQDIERLANRDGPLIFMGDLNAKIHNNTNEVGRALLSLQSYRIINIDEPPFATYIRTTTSIPTDIVFTNRKVTHAYTIEPGPYTVSDHRPVILKWDQPIQRVNAPPEKTTITPTGKHTKQNLSTPPPPSNYITNP